MRISRKNREGRQDRKFPRPLGKSARAAAPPFPSAEKYQLSRQLLGYQQDWVFDHSRFKFGLMARQTGKDFSAAYEGIYDCLLHEAQGQKTDWLIIAPSERQSLESLEKWKAWAQSFNLAIHDYQEERAGASESLLSAAAITFPRGSRVIAVPGKPETVRGFSANVLLTEFAFFEDPDQTWRALAPSIANPLRGGQKKVRIITTPNGIANKAHDLWVKNYKPGNEGGAKLPLSRPDNDCPSLPSVKSEGGLVAPKLPCEGGNGIANKAHDLWVKNYKPGNEGRAKLPLSRPDNDCPSLPSVKSEGGLVAPKLPCEGGWSCHFIDIYAARLHGLPVDLDQLRSALDDPDGWPQEFECQFIDVQTVLLPYQTIASCESAEATDKVPPDFWTAGRSGAPPLVMGLDFGRRRDLTVAWTNAALGDVASTVEVLELEKMSTPLQVEILRPRIKKVHRLCLDYTGPGVGLGDYLVKEFGQWDPARHRFGKIELCVFTHAFKVETFSKLRMAFDQRLLRVPISRVIREDLHSVNRVTTANGHITYRAPHHPDGHADRCTALALAWRAKSTANPAPAYARINTGNLPAHKQLRLSDFPVLL